MFGDKYFNVLFVWYVFIGVIFGVEYGKCFFNFIFGIIKFEYIFKYVWGFVSLFLFFIIVFWYGFCSELLIIFGNWLFFLLFL